MKLIINLLFVFCFSLNTQGQTYTRKSGESIDSLVGRTIDKNSFTCGVYEYSLDASSVITYFQVRNSKEIDNENLYYGETSTMLNVLYSSDKINYSKYLIDTVGVSNPCWAPVIADSILFINIDNDSNKEMCLILYHNPYCDAFIPFVQIMFFDDLESFPKLKNINQLASLNFQIHELPISGKSEIKSKIISTLKEKGVLNE